MAAPKDIILVTGCSGFIGGAVIESLAKDYQVVGLDRSRPERLPSSAGFIEIDLSSGDSIKSALARLRKQYGNRIASIIHLAAYFDLTGEPNPKYQEINVHGTERLLAELQSFDLEQFIFASTMLVHAPCKPGERINEDWPLDPKMPYQASKIEAEKMLRAKHGTIPLVLPRMAGVYDNRCRNAFLAHQIGRIHESRLIAHMYPGNLATGQSFLHLDDLIDALRKLIERRHELPPELPLLLGEEEVISLDELQREMGELLHGEEWQTWEVPKALAKTGAWIQDAAMGLEERFIKPWMVDIADDHYALDISRARKLIGWEPKHLLRDTLPMMIAVLKEDPAAWYRDNGLNTAKMEAVSAKEPAPPSKREMHAHHEEMAETHFQTLWAHFANIMLGLWLAASPFVWEGFSETEFREAVWRVTEDRSLWQPGLRHEILAWSDLISGLLIIAFACLSLFQRFAWAMWANTAMGCWLLFAPLVFWSPSAAVYANNTLVGSLVITFAILIPMMPGMSHEGMMDETYIPPGWTYCPSSWPQRIPIIGLALVGFLISRYLTAYQLGHIDAAWDPFFGDGTEVIITSDVSKAWPIADAGLGAVSYIFEILMGIMGDRRRWRTMPWMVLGFGIVVVPLGTVSILFIIIQPIVIGTWCSLCLLAALAMVIMIPFTLDELVATGQFLAEARRRGEPFWRSFFKGGAMPGGKQENMPHRESYIAEFQSEGRKHPLPWTLVACCFIGVWLMFTRFFDTVLPMAHSDHLIGALIITVAIAAMSEVGRALRFINIPFGLWLIAAPWLLEGTGDITVWINRAAGLALILLSLPRGKRSEQHYGSWDKYVI
jgi:nucleoside-diphosphate-sugar epimerase